MCALFERAVALSTAFELRLTCLSFLFFTLTNSCYIFSAMQFTLYGAFPDCTPGYLTHSNDHKLFSPDGQDEAQ